MDNVVCEKYGNKLGEANASVISQYVFILWSAVCCEYLQETKAVLNVVS